MIEISTRRASLAVLSVGLLGSQVVLAQGQPSQPIWDQSVCMSFLTAVGLFVAPPEMLFDLAKSRAGFAKESAE